MELGGTFEDDVIVEARDRQSAQQVVNYNVKVCSNQWFQEAQAADQSEQIQILKYLAESAYRNQEFAKACEHFQQALGLLPPNNTLMGRDMLESVARCYLSLGQPHQAVVHAQRLHEASQNFEQKTDSHLLLAQIFSKLGNTSGEALALQACLILHPDNPDLWMKLGHVYQKIKDARNSRRELTEPNTSVENVADKVGGETCINCSSETSVECYTGILHDCGDRVDGVTERGVGLGADHKGDSVPNGNEIGLPHEQQTTTHAQLAQSASHSFESISRCTRRKAAGKDKVTRVTDCWAKHPSHDSCEEESKKKLKNVSCQHVEQQLDTQDHRECKQDHRESKQDRRESKHYTADQGDSPNEELERMTIRLDKVCVDSNMKLDLNLVICACLLRARLLLQNVQRTVTSFAKTRNQMLQEQISKSLGELHIPQDTLQRCKTFMVKCALEADTGDLNSQIYVSQVDMFNDTLQREFERRWFSWIGSSP